MWDLIPCWTTSKNFNDFVGSKYEHVALALTLQATVAERAYKGASKKTKESATTDGTFTSSALWAHMTDLSL
jgi:hypothetical protein